jgi:hypothetical protein
MFTIDSIPDNFVKDDEKEKFIKKQIKKKYSELNKLAQTATELEITVGQMLNTLKQVVRKNEKKWKRYVEKNFPYLSIRTVQRWMKLAKTVDIENHPSLAYAGQTRLLTLANLAKRNKAEVDAFLKDGGVSLDFNTKKRPEVGKFRDKVDDLIKKHRPPKEKTASANSMINRLLKAAKELIQKFENDNDEEDVTESVDKNTLEHSIEEVEELLQMLKQIKKRFGGRRNKRRRAA